MTKQQIYLHIIELGILNIRLDAFRGDIKSCVAEADHIHNLPSILLEPSKEREDWYWNTETKCYRRDAVPDRLTVILPLWDALKKLREND